MYGFRGFRGLGCMGFRGLGFRGLGFRVNGGIDGNRRNRLRGLLQGMMYELRNYRDPFLHSLLSTREWLLRGRAFFDPGRFSYRKLKLLYPGLLQG